MPNLESMPRAPLRWLQQDPEDLLAELFVGADDRHFEGHFDGFPIFPGAQQLGIVLDLLGLHQGRRVQLKSVSRCKFSAVLPPETTVLVSVKLEDQNCLRWSLAGKDDGKTYSSGRLFFEQ